MYTFTTEQESAFDLDRDGISLFYSSDKQDKSSLVVCNKGNMFTIGKDCLLFNDKRAEIDMDRFRTYTSQSVSYKSLTHLIKICGLTEDIIHSGQLFVAFDERMDFLSAVKYVYSILGTLPPQARFSHKMHYAARYCGANNMRYNPGDDDFIQIFSASHVFNIEIGGGVIEALEPNENHPYQRVMLDVAEDRELIAGAVLQKMILDCDEDAAGMVMLDSFSSEISVGVWEKQFEPVIPQNINIPCKKAIILEKGYANVLLIKIGDAVLSYPLDGSLNNERAVNVTVDIDSCTGCFEIEMASENRLLVQTITFLDLIKYNNNK